MKSGKLRLWQKDKTKAEAIFERGAQAYCDDLPCLARAFHAMSEIHCVDGRTPGGVSLAGSGILLGLAGAACFVEAVRAGGSKIEWVTHHPDCGAVAVWTREHPESGRTVEENARWFAEELAKKIGAKAKRIENCEEHHRERAVYYDGVGGFDWTQVEGLPNGFTVSRRYLDFNPLYARSEAEVAIGIALGDHSFGELFNQKSPLMLIAIANDETELKRLKAELTPLIRDKNGRVKVDGFIAPRKSDCIIA